MAKEFLLSLIVTPSFELFGVKIVATKAVPSASAFGFVKSTEALIGHDGTKYYDYYVYDQTR